MTEDKYILFRLIIILSKLSSEQERDFISIVFSFNLDHSFMIDFSVLVILGSPMNTYSKYL